MKDFVKKIPKKQKKKKEKLDDDTIRPLTTGEKENMKQLIGKLEEHERIQLYHFIKMDDIKHTKQKNGILLNLNNASDEFTFKIYKFIKKCIDNQKFRKID